jgi:L-fucose isomerase-like protein
MATVVAPQANPRSSLSILSQPVTLGVIVGNRGFFPHHLAAEGREIILKQLAAAGIRAIVPEAGLTDHGAIESLDEARLCAEVFRAHRDEIDGILVTLPNFGDERAVANTIRFAELNVPVLVHAFPDDVRNMSLEHRRDSFCGKISVCNNLRQYNIPYSLTTLHTVDPTSQVFLSDLRRFAATCRVVRGMRRARIGLIGARPTNFNTVRFSEKLLEHAGISVETLDLSEVFGRVARLQDGEHAVVAKRAAIEGYANARDVPESAVVKMAKLSVVIDQWQEANQLDATSIQCWSAMEEYLGVVPCTIMSMASDSLIPSACESDVAGAVSMLALVLASGKPSALVDWNNNYGDDPDKGVVFHCSNLPKTILLDEIPRIDHNAILGKSFGTANAFGTVVGRVRENPFTYLRISTADHTGEITAYLGEGEFTDDPLDTFGGVGVVRIPRFQELLTFICEHGYEHHVSVNQTRVASIVQEAFVTYLGWQVYCHQ